MKKPLAAAAGAALALGVWAAPADAHTPRLTASCDQLTVDLFRYDVRTTLVVTIDGVPSTIVFDGDLVRTFTGTRTWRVQIDNAGRDYDLDRSGTFGGCTPPSTTTRPAPTTTQVPGWPSTTLPDTPSLPVPPVTSTVPVVDAPRILPAGDVPEAVVATPVETLKISFTG